MLHASRGHLKPGKPHQVSGKYTKIADLEKYIEKNKPN